MNTKDLRDLIMKGTTLDMDSEKRFREVITSKLLEAMGYDLTNAKEVGIEVQISTGHGGQGPIEKGLNRPSGNGTVK